MNQPLISILIPVFNGSADLPKCLDSILAQVYQPFEVVILNDGSTDATTVICKDYATKDSRIRYFEQQNHGLAATRNRLIHEAQGTYVSFIDADDDVEPTYLCYLWSLMQTSSCKVSACNHWICRGAQARPRFPVEDCYRILSPQEAFANILYDQYPDVSAWGKLYRKEILEQIAYPSGFLFEDTYCIADILLACRGVVYGGKPQYHYRIRTESLSHGKFNESKLDYLAAVNYMTDTIRSHSYNLENGINRRKIHALLSTRRYLVGCDPSAMEIRDELDADIRIGSASVLRDRQAPVRDKIGILSILLGTEVYDAFWTIYEKIRK